MQSAPHIVVVEDEVALAEIVRDYLDQEGMTVTLISDGTKAVQSILNINPDLVILDLMLPGKDGLTICRELRQESQVPIIMETAKAEEIDRLLGLELGADDYLCKPFSPRELVARVKAVLRRTQASAHEPGSPKRLLLNATTWQVQLDGRPLTLTRREFQLLAVLSKRPGQVYSRAQLLDLAFSDEADVFDRTVDSHIKNLRQKIKRIAGDTDPIRSVYGVGYAYEE